MTPDLQPDVSLLEIVLFSVLNPALIVVAFMMGRKCDQFAKIMIAAFAGAMAVMALLYVGALLGISDAPNLARAADGVFTACFLAGHIYAWIGYKFFPVTKT